MQTLNGWFAKCAARTPKAVSTGPSGSGAQAGKESSFQLSQGTPVFIQVPDLVCTQQEEKESRGFWFVGYFYSFGWGAFVLNDWFNESLYIRRRRHTKRHREDTMWHRSRVEWWVYKWRNSSGAWSQLKLEEADDPPESLQRELCLPTPCFQTPASRTGREPISVVWSPPVLANVLWQP